MLNHVNFSHPYAYSDDTGNILRTGRVYGLKTLVFLLQLCMIVSLVGCGKQTNERESITATLHFYYEPTLERTTPNGMSTTELNSEHTTDAEYIKGIKRILDDVDEWDDDYTANRLEYYFNGDIKFSDSDFVYYFSYENNVIYYDHCFAKIADADMEYIKTII